MSSVDRLSTHISNGLMAQGKDRTDMYRIDSLFNDFKSVFERSKINSSFLDSKLRILDKYLLKIVEASREFWVAREGMAEPLLWAFKQKDRIVMEKMVPMVVLASLVLYTTPKEKQALFDVMHALAKEGQIPGFFPFRSWASDRHYRNGVFPDNYKGLKMVSLLRETPFYDHPFWDSYRTQGLSTFLHDENN